jgi:hypothetical protein
MQALMTERVQLDSLRAHPRNYRAHPPEQLEHIEASLTEHGLYRNVVIAEDGTILAGHGVVLAAMRKGWTELDVVRLPISPDSAQALRLLAGDNETGRLAMLDDRALVGLLKDIQIDDPAGLLGTGFDEAMLAGLLYAITPKKEIDDMDEAAQWAGMPEFEGIDRAPRLVITFDSFQGRREFVEQSGVSLMATTSDPESRVWSARWPPRVREDLSAVRYE